MSYLEEYLDKVNVLPIDVNRQLRLIKELDIKLQKSQGMLDKYQDDYLQSLKQIKEKKGDSKKIDGMKKDIEKLQKECLSLSEEKMATADQLYFSIDDSIKELEKDMKKFDEELKVQSTNVEIKEEKQDVQIKKKQKKYEQKLLSKYAKDKKNDKDSQLAIAQNKTDIFNEWAIDPNEPIYCVCKRPSFGEMIKCDNPFCDYGVWFHFECVQITVHPKGKWYCQGCYPLKKNLLIK